MNSSGMNSVIKGFSSRSISISRSTLVTIRTYNHPLQANLVKARLETEGINVFLADETTIYVNWFYSIAMGGVRLQVMNQDVHHARQIISEAVEIDEDLVEKVAIPEALVRCPRCDSIKVHYETFNHRFVFIAQLVTFFITGNYGIPVPIIKRGWKCNNCGYSWKENPG